VTDYQYESRDFTETFLHSLVSRDFTTADREAFVRALRLLDEDERTLRFASIS